QKILMPNTAVGKLMGVQTLQTLGDQKIVVVQRAPQNPIAISAAADSGQQDGHHVGQGEVSVQEADALGVNLGNFGDTFTAEEAAELLGGVCVEQGGGSGDQQGLGGGDGMNGDGSENMGLKGGCPKYTDKSTFSW